MENIDTLKEEVHRANAWFYQAFEKMDIAAMENVWLTDDSIRCIHPGWNLLKGWDEIYESWQTIFDNTEYIEFSITDVHIEIEGDVAWVTCQENITQAFDQKTIQNMTQATNIFVHRDQYWKLVHHHGSPIFQPPDDRQESDE